MKQPSAVCLVVDRLPAHLLGAYGNTWIHTPAFDALAAEALLCEFATLDSPRLDRLYRAYLSGQHAARPAATAAAETLPALLRSAGIGSRAVCDDAEAARILGSYPFDDVVALPVESSGTAAAALEETDAARFFSAAIDALADLRESSLLWLHARGLGGPWDAPYFLRSEYADEEDPTPPEFVDIPDRMLAADHDPDERLGLQHAAAGQVTAIDACFGALLDALDASPRGQDTLLIVLGARGFPLGEHLRVGRCDEALYAELVHVPLLVRLPASRAPARTSSLVQPQDIFPTLLDWFGIERGAAIGAGEGSSLLPLARGEAAPARDRAVAIGQEGEWGIRTNAWYLRQVATPAGPRRELFVKPDDRWELNDVGRRLSDVVETLATLGEEYLAQQRTAADSPPPLTPLDQVLDEGLA